MRITTWNTQGDPRNAVAKQQRLEAMLAVSDYVLLQECGQLAKTRSYIAATLGNEAWTVFGFIHPGAYNERCATAILYRTAHAGNVRNLEPVTLPQSMRYANFVRDNGQEIIGTFHAVASSGAQHDGTTFAKEAWAAARRLGSDTVIIGGDFNSPPPPMKLIGSSTRGMTFAAQSAGAPTHSRGGELDYFLTINLENRAAGVTHQGQTPASDHAPVTLTYT